MELPSFRKNQISPPGLGQFELACIGQVGLAFNFEESWVLLDDCT